MGISGTPIRGGRRRLEIRAGDETGQVLALFVISLVVVLGMVALAIDVGHAFYVKRSLQASADAAATAAALELPDGGAARSRALQYGSGGGGKNESPLIPGVTTATTLRCLPAAPCNPVNAITVRESTTVKTFFARVVGVGSFDISARATACSPCGARPLDVMVIIDRSSSMCTTSDGRPDPACTDMNNARDGARAFMQVMDPAVDLVGLAVFPPVSSMANVCEQSDASTYNSKASPYVIAPLVKDYLLNGALNPSSTLVRNLTCMHYGIGTSYATAIEQAQAELDAHGRPDADDVIVMLTDGAANRGPTYFPASSNYRTRPCQQGIDSAAAAKAKGTTIYTIGYDIYADGDADCHESPVISTEQTLTSIATNREHFYNQPVAGELVSIFTHIAVSLNGTRLVDDPND
jgi:hypothetical protein